MSGYKISLANTWLSEKTKKLVNEALNSGYIADGPFIEMFEEKVARFTGARYCVATCNGTIADLIMLLVMRLRSSKSKVIMPALTFKAQFNAVQLAGQLKAEFVDCNWHYQMLYEDALELVDEDTLCVFPANIMGWECEAADKPYCERPVIVDSCELFAQNTHKGLMTAYSFYATHSLPIGEGGVITTNDADVFIDCKRLRDHGSHTPIGMGVNGKMSNIQAAIGCGELDDYEAFDERKALENFKKLDALLRINRTADSPEPIVPHGYPIQLSSREERDRLRKRLDECGIQNRAMFPCLDRSCEAATRLSDTNLYIPIHMGLNRYQLEYISECVSSFIYK
jgi:dTDP-4-amino-4,6-dideoxygalactose transaminase